jgi:translation initiation factor eIF-2B subunit gamma
METLIPTKPADDKPDPTSSGVPHDSSSSDSEDSDFIAVGASPETVGTARILRRWRDWIRSDFVVLPCDITPPPSLPLTKLLNRHRNQTGSLVTSLWYEKSEVELKDADGELRVVGRGPVLICRDSTRVHVGWI